MSSTSQFQAIQTRIGKDALVWPGVEIDVYDGNEKGHLLVITSPTLAAKLATAVVALTKGFTPDTFKVTIQDVLATFDAMEPLLCRPLQAEAAERLGRHAQGIRGRGQEQVVCPQGSE